MFSSISKIVALAILVVAAGASPAANGHEGPTTTVTVTAQPTSTSVSQCNNGGTQP
ncbi:hypothetical protein BT96DRAFT_988548 [Gymnopus androsaceus JB14]|uniref:Uncharacterized protein n=1 Tax=Gymnopus androsaceus JB14 TaxID=1447944 RepID=A0A6A4I0J3_9AGAR|nr:hypothetical protein BT96DRAFT_988548 [Gymnopus androsaceus JB14]